jgi:Putative restriction endonuclease
MAMPRTDPATEFAELERLWYELEVPEGVRLELIDDELVVSPTGSVSHSGAISALIFQVIDHVRDQDWIIHTNLTAHIAATRERLIPDLMVAPGGASPLYLLIDRLDKSPAVTLFSRPGANGYARHQVATAGQPLRLPKPFGIVLDTARLLGEA